MNVLIVYAHPEPRSFNGAMKALADHVLKEQGHNVRLSDLYAMNFKAIADSDDFLQRADEDYFKYETEQAHAAEVGGFSPDITIEQEKVLWADLVIFQFPLWGWSFPAIMKGWIDRVLAGGFAHSVGRWYDQGLLAGRKAMLCTTTAAPEVSCGPRGLNGDMRQLLYHINHGILYWAGFQILPPFIAWAVPFVDLAQRKEYLNEYAERLRQIESLEPITYRQLADCDESGCIKEALPLDPPFDE